MTRGIEPMPHYHQLRGNHFLSNLWPQRWAAAATRRIVEDEPWEPEVDEPNPDDGMATMDDHDPDCNRDWVDDPPEYDPELNMNQDAPISYWEGHDTHEEAEGLR